MTFGKVCVLGLLSITGTLALAEVPVIDYSSDNETVPQVAKSRSLESRVERLEQQMENLNKQNLLSKLDALQEKLQKLDGKLEEQAHQVEQLNLNVKNFYQDLDKKPKVVPPPSVPKAPTVSFKEQQVYQAAIDLLPDKKYNESATKLRFYITNYPNGTYIANAHYWLGEIYFLQKNYTSAVTQFKLVTDKYAGSKKVADALLKIAIIHELQGKHEQAVGELKHVVSQFPNTSAAQLAKQQLQEP